LKRQNLPNGPGHKQHPKQNPQPLARPRQKKANPPGIPAKPATTCPPSTPPISDTCASDVAAPESFAIAVPINAIVAQITCPTIHTAMNSTPNTTLQPLTPFATAGTGVTALMPEP
jgi:hypothetical protein